MATFNVDCAARRISIHGPGGFAVSDSCEHFLLDQLAPRILAHEGAMVVHAAALRRGARALLLVGISGRGKSTLAAALEQAGAELLGDDAAILALDGGDVLVRAVYRSLRLLPDSLQALYAGSRPTRAMAAYSAKRRLACDPVPAGRPVPVAAIFVLAEPAPEIDQPEFEVMAPPAACIELLREFFALDPTDTHQAAARLYQAGAVVQQVPVFTFAYPRDYARLPQAAASLLGKVDELT